MLFKTPTQGSSAIPAFGGQTLIVARRTGLLISVEEAVGSDETSAYSDLNGTQTVTFDIRKYSAMLMAFPIKSAVQPYLGVGWGIIHVVNPQTVGGLHDDAVELGSEQLGSFVGGVQFQVGRFMAFGRYGITYRRVERHGRGRHRRPGRLRPPARGPDPHLLRWPAFRPRQRAGKAPDRGLLSGTGSQRT